MSNLLISAFLLWKAKNKKGKKAVLYTIIQLIITASCLLSFMMATVAHVGQIEDADNIGGIFLYVACIAFCGFATSKTAKQIQ